MNMRERVAMAIYETDDRSGHWAEWDELDHEDPTRLYSLKRAEIILDELMTPTEGMADASVKTEHVDAICWVSSLLGTGVHSAQDLTVSSYTAMIKAAKDGK